MVSSTPATLTPPSTRRSPRVGMTRRWPSTTSTTSTGHDLLPGRCRSGVRCLRVEGRGPPPTPSGSSFDLCEHAIDKFVATSCRATCQPVKFLNQVGHSLQLSPGRQSLDDLVFHIQDPD